MDLVKLCLAFCCYGKHQFQALQLFSWAMSNVSETIATIAKPTLVKSITTVSEHFNTISLELYLLSAFF